MTADLSPATEAILDAVCLSVFDAPAHACPNLVADVAPKLAQALRAVVKSCMDVDDYGFHALDSDKILAIAAELEDICFTPPTAP